MDNFRRIGLEKIAEDKIPSSAVPINLTNTDTISGNVLYVPLFRDNRSYRKDSSSIYFYFPAYGTKGSLDYFGITCEGSLVSIESGDFSTTWPSNTIKFGGNYDYDYFAPCIHNGNLDIGYSDAGTASLLGGYSGKVFPLDSLPILLTSTKATLSRWSGDNDYYVKLKFSAPFTFTGRDNNGTTWPHPPYVDTES